MLDIVDKLKKAFHVYSNIRPQRVKISIKFVRLYDNFTYERYIRLGLSIAYFNFDAIDLTFGNKHSIEILFGLIIIIII